MASAIKFIISSRKNLEKKYGNKFSDVLQLLNSLVKADVAKNLDTRILFIDDKTSAKNAGIKVAATITPQSCKKAIDELYNLHQPAYMVILGAQDIFPFQKITNPVHESGDDDTTVPSDLPYACNTPYGTKISAFTGPTRVVGRIPDVPGKSDTGYLKIVIGNSIKHKPVPQGTYMKYFAVSASVWEKSTQLNLQSMFGNFKDLLLSPPANGGYTKAKLKPMIHFYNCHGALVDSNYYGQKGDDYPVSLKSPDIKNKVSYGTVVAAECCYGAQLFNESDVDPKSLSISNNYLLNNAVSFTGSSTIAYGESDSVSNADLMTQYFIRSVLNGASAGRALLEARQKFLVTSGPQLDPYELKTLAQYYLLGDPSIQPVVVSEPKAKGMVPQNTIENRRLNLFNKGVNLKKTIEPSAHVKLEALPKHSDMLKKIFKEIDFSGKEIQAVYAIKQKTPAVSGNAKAMNAPGTHVRYRTFIKPAKVTGRSHFKVLVIKEDNDQMLGWKIYVSK